MEFRRVLFRSPSSIVGTASLQETISKRTDLAQQIVPVASMGRWLDDELAAVGRQMRSGALDRARCLGPMLAIDDDGVHALRDRNSLIPFDPENGRSEEHTSELQSLMLISYADFCLKKKTSTLMKVEI